MDNRAIGVFDSGLGGLIILKAMMELTPDEDIIYFGDCGRTPYGTRSKERIVNYALQSARFLMEKDIKLLVIACNTASAYGYEPVKQELGIPVIEVICPGARAGMAATRNKKVGVIGTNATINSGAYEREIKKLDPNIEVFSKACPLLVPLVEEGEYWWECKATEDIVKVYLEDFSNDGIDTLILGCTHFPMLINPIKKALNDNVTLVNTAVETALCVRQALYEFDIASNQRECVTFAGDVEYDAHLIQRGRREQCTQHDQSKQSDLQEGSERHERNERHDQSKQSDLQEGSERHERNERHERSKQSDLQERNERHEQSKQSDPQEGSDPHEQSERHEQSKKNTPQELSESCPQQEHSDQHGRVRLFTSDRVDKFESLCASILKCNSNELQVSNVDIEKY